eukprot:Em0006g899a
MSHGALLSALLLLASARVSVPQSSLGCTNNVTDVSYINDTSSCSCNPGTSLVVVSGTSPPMLKWTFQRDAAVTGYQVFYWMRRSTVVVTKVVSDPNATGTSLDQLSGPEVYRVAVRAVCGGNSTYGSATPFNEFAIAQAPTAFVSNLKATTPFNGSYTLALLKWDPIPWTQWNGDPIGYWICLGEKMSNNFTYCNILVNDSSRTQYLLANLKTNTQYYVGIKAVSTGGTGPGPSPTNVTLFTTQAPATVTQDFLRSAYVYMLVPAAVFSVVIVLMVVVVCKRESERKKQVTYCKGIYNLNSPNGVNGVPFYRPTTAQSDPRPQQPPRGRPIPSTVPSAKPLSNCLGTSPHRHDTGGWAPRGPGIRAPRGSERKWKYGNRQRPVEFGLLGGPVAPGIVPRHRHPTTPAGQGPDHLLGVSLLHTRSPGARFPEGSTRAALSVCQAQGPQGARDYYPPHPVHSPPPVGAGHEPVEVFGRVPPAGIHQPIPQVRSAGMIAPLPSHGGAREGRGPRAPQWQRGGNGPQDTILESSGEIVYIERSPEGGNESLRRDPPPLDPYSVGTGVEYTNGSILTTASSDHYSSYSEVTEPSNSMAHRMPHPPYHPAHDRHRPTRDSEFSETSSFSGSSGSLRARSPPQGRGVTSGWGHEYRGGAMSEVGHQQERSESPVDRRSEVGGVMSHNRKQAQTQPMQRPSISHNSSSKLISMASNGN